MTRMPPTAESSGWRRFVAAMSGAGAAATRGVGAVLSFSRRNVHFVHPLINGFFGDKLAASGDPLAIRMSFRLDGRDVSLHELRLEERLRGEGRDVVVMVHGHCADEVPFITTSSGSPGYGALVEQRLGATVLLVRYNSGLHVSENGRALSFLLQSLTDAHGRRIRSLILIGHSMGGLIVRSAGYYADPGSDRADKPEAGWTDKLSAVILIGTPIMGSYVEQIAHLSSTVLRTILSFHTRLIGRIMDERSNGIKDMRNGALVDEDWGRQAHQGNEAHHGKEAHRGKEALETRRVPLLPHVSYHVLAGTLSEDVGSAWALFLGDGMVGKASALGKGLLGRDDPIARQSTCHLFPGSSHYHTLEDPRIGERVLEIIRQIRTSESGTVGTDSSPIEGVHRFDNSTVDG